MSKILIVDEEPDVLAVTVARLETSGYEVLVAKDSEEAIELLNNGNPDLILLDISLPKMQGDELCKKLKSDIKFKHIPIILFTASIVLHAAMKVNKLGADDLIIKPVDPNVLLDKIKKLIG